MAAHQVDVGEGHSKGAIRCDNRDRTLCRVTPGRVSWTACRRIGAKGGIALDEAHGRERFPAIGRARKSQFLTTIVAIAAVPVMIVGPYHIDAPAILAFRLVNSHPRFVIKSPICRVQRH